MWRLIPRCNSITQCRLDNFFDAALESPAAERTKEIQQTFLKVAALSKNLDKLTADSVIPFNATESKFLIGLAFRLTLRDTIFLSELRTNQGVLRNKVDKWRREPLTGTFCNIVLRTMCRNSSARIMRGKG